MEEARELSHALYDSSCRRRSKLKVYNRCTFLNAVSTSKLYSAKRTLGSRLVSGNSVALSKPRRLRSCCICEADRMSSNQSLPGMDLLRSYPQRYA